MQIKFNYTTGNEFSLSGEDYEGYYNVHSDGSVYSGRYFDNTSSSLTPYNRFISTLITSDLFRDRIIFEPSELKYSADDILIGANEIAVAGALNSKLGYIQQNNLELFSRMYIGSTAVPVGYNPESSFGTVVDEYINTDQSLTFTDETSALSANEAVYSGDGYIVASITNLNYGLSAYGDASTLKKIVSFPKDDGYYVIGIADSFLIVLSAADGYGSSTMVHYTSAIDEDSDEFFSDLKGITWNGSDLFVGGSSIYKYNIDGTAFQDDTLGYKITLNNATPIDNLSSLGSNADLIYSITDTTIKIFDDNLVYKGEIIFPKDSISKIIDIQYNKLRNKIYVLVKDDFYRFYIINADHSVDSSVAIKDNYIYGNEEPIAFAFSEQDSNVLYLLTNYNVYKKFVSNLGYSFALFDLSAIYGNRRPGRFKDITVTGLDNGWENIFILESGAIFQFIEKTEYISLLNTTTSEYYLSEDIEIVPDEYVQAAVINKEINKILFNTLLLKNYIKGYPAVEFDIHGVFKVFLQYISDADMKELYIEDEEIDSMINDNSPVCTGAINSVLQRIVDLQYGILGVIQSKELNSRTISSENDLYILD